MASSAVKCAEKLCMAAGGFSAAGLDAQRFGECLYSHGVLSKSVI